MSFIKVFETNFISLHLPGVLRESLRLVRGQEALVLFGGGIDMDRLGLRESPPIPVAQVASQSHRSHGSAWLCQVNRGCDPFDCQDRDRATELQFSESVLGPWNSIPVIHTHLQNLLFSNIIHCLDPFTLFTLRFFAPLNPLTAFVLVSPCITKPSS